jgi:hypothetical protein
MDDEMTARQVCGCCSKGVATVLLLLLAMLLIDISFFV